MYATQASGMKNTTFSTELNRSIHEGNVLFDTRLQYVDSTQKTLDQSGTHANAFDIIEMNDEEYQQ